MPKLDARLNAYRPDLAAEALRGRVEATRYAAGEPAQVAAGVADLRRRPEPAAPLDTQLLSGETVTVYEDKDGWAWVQNARDGYVGYIESTALRRQVLAPTHFVKVLRSYVFPEPDLKTPPLDLLTMSGGVAVAQIKDNFAERAEGGWVYAAHLAGPEEPDPDYVTMALQFLGTPYLWGGKGSVGLDCSGLIQVVMARAGIDSPRDTDMQAESLGEAIDWVPGQSRVARGDLVFFPGHVAIALDEKDAVHANAGHMMVAIEDLAHLEARVREETGGTGITVVRRI